MNCNLFRAIRLGYFRSMVRYCNAWGWRYFWRDTFSIKAARLTPPQTEGRES